MSGGGKKKQDDSSLNSTECDLTYGGRGAEDATMSAAAESAD